MKPDPISIGTGKKWPLAVVEDLSGVRCWWCLQVQPLCARSHPASPITERNWIKWPGQAHEEFQDDAAARLSESMTIVGPCWPVARRLAYVEGSETHSLLALFWTILAIKR